jgi:hypothetical protein
MVINSNVLVLVNLKWNDDRDRSWSESIGFIVTKDGKNVLK